jgi:hypothetical protein
MTEKNSRDGRPWISGQNAIAEHIGCHRNQIPGLIRREGLPAFKFLGKWRIVQEDMNLWSRKVAARHKKPARRRRPSE